MRILQIAAACAAVSSRGRRKEERIHRYGSVHRCGLSPICDLSQMWNVKSPTEIHPAKMRRDWNGLLSMDFLPEYWAKQINVVLETKFLEGRGY